jgi:hypothetical protein
LSNNAMATAGASSVAIATLVADFLVRFTAADFDRTPRALGAAFWARFGLAAGALGEVVMFHVLRLRAKIYTLDRHSCRCQG